MKYLVLFFLFLNLSPVHALSEKEAGVRCGGWYTAGRTELDDQVFFDCVEAKMKNQKFSEKLARKKHAKSLCSGQKSCMNKMLKTPSRLAIIDGPKEKGRGVASKKKQK